MKISSPYKCDVCGSLKQTTNHWWLLIAPCDCSDLVQTPSECKRIGFLLIPWDNTISDLDECIHLCSQKCALARLDKWMSEKALLTAE
jgi:hypothetical protein